MKTEHLFWAFVVWSLLLCCEVNSFDIWVTTTPEAPFLAGSAFTWTWNLDLVQDEPMRIRFYAVGPIEYYVEGSMAVSGPSGFACFEEEGICEWNGGSAGLATVNKAYKSTTDYTIISSQATWGYPHTSGASGIWQIESEYRVSLTITLLPPASPFFDQGGVLSFSASISNDGPSGSRYGDCLLTISPKEAGAWIEDSLAPYVCAPITPDMDVIACSFDYLPNDGTSVEFVSGVQVATNASHPLNFTVSLGSCSPTYPSMRILETNYTNPLHYFTVIPTRTAPSESDASSSSSSSSSSQDRVVQPEDDEDDKTPIIAGASAGGVFLFLLLGAVLVVVVYFLRRDKRTALSLEMRDMENAPELYGTKKDFAQDCAASSPSRMLSEEGEEDEAGGIEWEIPSAELEYGEKIGEGAFGTVWKGFWRNSEVAIKQLAGLGSEQNMESFKAEIELMQRLRPHANVVLLMGACIEEGRPCCLVTELLSRGDLLHFLHSNEGKMAMKNEKTFLRMAREIAAGMSHLHAEGIIHRDLAARNLLLGKDLTIKVSDFGLAHKQENESEEKSLGKDEIVPIKWLAPEVLASYTYGPSADVWSYGVTLWEMANLGMTPYPDMNTEEASMAIQEGKHPDIPTSIPSALQSVMKECFSFDPQDRPTFSEIVKMLKARD
ncbi:Protein tyrosine kinase 2 beta [Balamuthia mandrillaris]